MSRQARSKVDPGFASPSDCLSVLLSIRWPILVLAFLLIAAACGDGSEPSSLAGDPCREGPQAPPPTDNVFANPSFEDGGAPWCFLKPPAFIVSEGVAHTGSSSALLPLQADESEEGNKIAYLVQEIKVEELPEVLSGYYRVENWSKGTEKQYLQFVVIVWEADNAPIINNRPVANHQIRYLLAGIDSPPFEIANAQFVFVSRDDPPIGEWVRFELNLREDFEDLWGAVPVGFEHIRVLFEVRYDDKATGEGPLSADVYYDDLYFGPAPSP